MLASRVHVRAPAQAFCLASLDQSPPNKSAVGVLKAHGWSGCTLDGVASPSGGLVYLLPAKEILEYLNNRMKHFNLDVTNLDNPAVFSWYANEIVLTRAAILRYALQYDLPIPSWWNAEDPKYTKPVVVNFSSGISNITPADPLPPTAPQLGWNQNTGFAGRPAKSRNLLREEMRRRAQEGRLCKSVAEQARSLCAWLASHYPDAPLPSPKTVENNFREEYWGLRRLSDARATETNEPSSTKNDRSPFRQPYLT